MPFYGCDFTTEINSQIFYLSSDISSWSYEMIYYEDKWNVKQMECLKFYFQVY